MGKQTVAVKGSGGLPHRGAGGPAGAAAAGPAGPAGPTSPAGGPAHTDPAGHPASAAAARSGSPASADDLVSERFRYFVVTTCCCVCCSSAPQQQVIVQDSKILQHMSATGMVSQKERPWLWPLLVTVQLHTLVGHSPRDSA